MSSETHGDYSVKILALCEPLFYWGWAGMFIHGDRVPEEPSGEARHGGC